MLKQQNVGLKGISKSATPVNEDVPPLLEAGGKLEVCLSVLTCYLRFCYEFYPF